MSDHTAEGKYVPDFLHELADKIDAGEIRVERAIAKPNIREIKRDQEIKIKRNYVRETAVIEVGANEE